MGRRFLPLLSQLRKSITTSSWSRAANLPVRGAINLSIRAGLTRLAIGEPSSACKHRPTYGCRKLASKSSQQICRGLSHLLDWTTMAVTNKYLIIPQHSNSPHTFIYHQVPWLQHNTPQQSNGTTGTTTMLLSVLYAPSFTRQQHALGRQWCWHMQLFTALPRTGPLFFLVCQGSPLNMEGEK